MAHGRYEPIGPNTQGWLWCDALGLWLGLADHRFVKQADPVKTLRFFDAQGQLILTEAEAEAAARRAAEAEVARLKGLLEESGTVPLGTTPRMKTYDGGRRSAVGGRIFRGV